MKVFSQKILHYTSIKMAIKVNLQPHLPRLTRYSKDNLALIKLHRNRVPAFMVLSRGMKHNMINALVKLK